MELFSRQPKSDPAQKRYPAAMAELLTLGDTDDEIDYASYAAALADHTPDLIRMVLDDDLAQRENEDPAAWAPFHALEVLAILGPEEAAEPLLACLAWEADWPNNELERVFAGIGPVAIPPLLAYLEDGSHETLARAHASNALRAIAKMYPTARDEIIEALTAFLDRPTADDSADEELITAFVIGDLTDLNATGAYDAIARAFAENRVDQQILDLEFVEQAFGMRPKRDYSEPVLREEPGVYLVLKCKVCGRERPHIFPKVYYDIPTALDEKKRARYDPLIIPQRVTCPKCGAVDQYELSTMGHIAITANMLAASKLEGESFVRKDQQIKFLTFTTRWGEMHPTEADERYQAELIKKPNDADLHVGYANLKRFLGYPDEALAHYNQALGLDPNNAEAWLNLAQMAGERRNMDEALRCWEKVRETARRGKSFSTQNADYAAAAEISLGLLRRGIFPDNDLDDLDDIDVELTTGGRPAPENRSKVGRNDPCPCGSGKKYK
ncbi:MAG: SEC-C metal-binding domain-containing protein, partial [Caldilinea sp.]